ncbi:MAG: hypothetical protein LBF85_08090 [Tannerella sp.]|nr:hypothetical protein [Tannerella sp.]
MEKVEARRIEANRAEYGRLRKDTNCIDAATVSPVIAGSVATWQSRYMHHPELPRLTARNCRPPSRHWQARSNPAV